MSDAATPYPSATAADTQRVVRQLMTPEGVPLRIELADPGERIAAFITDVALATTGALLILVAGVILSIGTEITLPIALFLSFVVRNVYFIFFELHWGGATPGKRIFRLRVIDRRGGPLRAGAVVARNLTRQAEFFFPLEMLFMAHGWVWSPGQIAPVVIWIALMIAVVYRTPDRLRAGDLIGGTIVIAVPRRILVEDLASENQGFRFTDEQLQHYGIKELQLLEEVLRQPHNVESARLRFEVCERIQRRIGWTEGFRGEQIENFLRDFYTAQRAFLESRKNFGEERADKHHGRQS